MTLEVLDEKTIAEEPRFLEGLGPRITVLAGGVGIAALVAGAIYGAMMGDGFRRFSFAYLHNFSYFLSLALGALFFVAIQHITKATWSVVVRRIAEVCAATLPVLAFFALPLILLAGSLYAWTDTSAATPGSLLAVKLPYLNVPFFAVRLGIYFAVWSYLALRYLRDSLKQDKTGDPAITTSLQRMSAPALVLYGLTITFAAFDLLMSLDYEWFSTIFGVYFFSGSIVGFFALLPVLIFFLQLSGRLKRSITIEHYHDMGKLIFAFMVFWTYIAFCQYFLIWYANLPEETAWFLKRQTGDWSIFSLALIAGHFVIPFLYLISRGIKRNKILLLIGALWMLVWHWLDLYYLIMPELTPGGSNLPLHPLDLLCFIGLGGIFLAAMAKIAGRHSLIPVGDPRLGESLKFENV